MKKTMIRVFALVLFAALVVAGYMAWRMRPWRVVASVNGHAVTAREITLRAQMLLDDAKRTEHLMYPKERESEALDHFRREATKKWIVKEVLLAEALARGYEVTQADEKESLMQMTAGLKSRNLTPELKRREFKEGVLINKFTTKEVSEKISIDPKEIEERLVQLQHLELARTKPGDTSKQPKISRKMAIDSLRAERFRQGFRTLFRTLYEKAQVTCPEYPELGRLEGVSPSRPEDKAKEAK